MMRYTKYCNKSVKPGGGGRGLFKTRPSREGDYSRGWLIREGVYPKSGKYVAKGPKKRLEVLKK